MKAVAVTVNGEKIAVTGKYEWQIDRYIRRCYVNKYERVVIEKIR